MSLELWIPITIAAAFMQNLRSMLQRHLKGSLSTMGATVSRFLFAAPLAIAFVIVNTWFLGGTVPGVTPEFLIFAVTGGVAQIVATALLVHLFGLRNFAVGTTFSKTETVQTALFGLVFLGDRLSVMATAGIVVSLAGILLISGRMARGREIFSRAALVGLASGASFGVAAVSYRGAALALAGGDFISRATVTLAVVIVFQTIVSVIWLRLREPGQVTAMLRSWRVSLWVGVTGGAASLGWFSAMTIQNAAYVRALGQTELVFTLVASWLFFGERSTRSELLGILLVTAGILVLLTGR
ncbi:MAG: DMT family transporter [Paracoccaceae bacterium]